MAMTLKDREEESNRKLLEELRREIEDDDYRLMLDRDKEKYVFIHIRPRTITTKLGTFTYQRRIYAYYDEKTKKVKYCSLVDEKYGVSRRRRMHKELVDLILENMGTGKRYRDIIDMAPFANLTKSQIHYVIKESKAKQKFSKSVYTKQEERVELLETTVVHVNIDDGWPPVRNEKGKAKKRRTTVFSMHTGIDEELSKKEGKRRLANKRVAPKMSKGKSFGAKQAAKAVIKFLNTFYKGVSKAMVVIGGDGAPWIRNVAKFLDVPYLLDRWHALNKLKGEFMVGRKKRDPGNVALYNAAVEWFLAGDYDHLIMLLEAHASDDTMRYFINNEEGVRNQAEEWAKIGVSAESEISRVLKSAYGYGAKIYSEKVFENIIYDRAYRINNGMGV